jgi:hypothetical protein
VLAFPFDREIPQAHHANAPRQPSIDCGLDQRRCEEGKCDRSVNLSDTAGFPSAICSTFGIVPVINSSSQRRPVAIAVISLARVSARIGRGSAGDAVRDGAMISRGCFAGFFFHGMRRAVALG